MLLNRLEEVNCTSPLLVRDSNTGVSRYVPCGHCPLCSSRYKRDWSVRLILESRTHVDSSFVTLTYEKKPLYINYRLVQLFLKRLRKTGLIFKYFCANEHGEKTGRIHHHLIFFGLKASVLLPLVRQYWTYGFVTCSPLTDSRCRYTANYVNKKIIDNDYNPNFCHMSKGIGADWLKSHIEEVKKNNYINLDGFKYPFPRFFVKYLRKNDEKWYYQYIRSFVSNSYDSFSDFFVGSDRKISQIKQKSVDLVEKIKLLKGGIL